MCANTHYSTRIKRAHESQSGDWLKEFKVCRWTAAAADQIWTTDSKLKIQEGI